MKNNKLTITTIIFFLTINTTYYWEGKLGIWAIPATLLLLLVYIGLVIALARKIYFAFRNNFSDKSQLLLIGILTLILTITFIKPFGLINFDKLEGDNILVAEREGSANCMTTLKLKENNRFVERSVCFGVTEIKGTYKLKNDTIYFENVDSSRQKYEYHKFAVIKQSKYRSDKKVVDFVRYTNSNDTIEYELFITKNELSKLTNIKPNSQQRFGNSGK